MKIKQLITDFKLNQLMYIIFTIYIGNLLLNETCLVYINNSFNLFLKIVRYLCYFFFAIKIINDWVKGDKITIGIVLLGVCSIATYFCANKKNIFFLLFVFWACRNLNISKMLKITFFTYTILFFAIITCSILKFIPDWLYLRGDLIRHSLGFYYSTVPIGVYLIIVLLFFYLKKNKYTYIELLFLELIAVLLYGYTNGRLGFYLNSLIIGIMFLKKTRLLHKIMEWGFIQKCLKVICYSLPFFFLILSLGISLLYNKEVPFLKKIDLILSQRIEYSQKALELYDITLFGEDLDWKGYAGNGILDQELVTKENYNYVDISYLRILLDNGLIITIIALCAFTYLLIKYEKKKDYTMLMIIFVLLIYGLVEPELINLSRNVFLLELIPLINLGELEFLSFDKIKKKINIFGKSKE